MNEEDNTPLTYWERAQLRDTQEKFLSKTDKYVLKDYQIDKGYTAQQVQEIEDYRKAWRHLEEQFDGINNISEIVYPVAPSFIPI